MVKPAAGSTPLAYSSPEAVQTTGTVATPKLIAALVDVETTGTNLARDRVRRVALTLGCQPADDPVTTPAARDRKFADLYGSFCVKWFFGLLPVPCLERKGRSSSRRLRSGSRRARRGSRDRNASAA